MRNKNSSSKNDLAVSLYSPPLPLQLVPPFLPFFPVLANRATCCCIAVGFPALGATFSNLFLLPTDYSATLSCLVKFAEMSEISRTK